MENPITLEPYKRKLLADGCANKAEILKLFKAAHPNQQLKIAQFLVKYTLDKNRETNREDLLSTIPGNLLKTQLRFLVTNRSFFCPKPMTYHSAEFLKYYLQKKGSEPIFVDKTFDEVSLILKELNSSLSKKSYEPITFATLNLSKVDFSNADLSSVNLSGANLSGANLSKAILLFPLSAIFDGKTNFQDALIDLKKFEDQIKAFFQNCKDNNQACHLLFNPRQNENRGVLKTIASLDGPSQIKLRVSLIETVLNFIDSEKINISEVADFFAEFLFLYYPKTEYLGNETVQKFCIKNILSEKVNLAKIKAVNFVLGEARMVAASLAGEENFFTEHGALINQLWFQYPGEPYVQEIWKIYCAFKPIARIREHLKSLGHDGEHIILSQDGRLAIAVTKSYMAKYLYLTGDDEDLSWTNICAYQWDPDQENPVMMGFIKSSRLQDIFSAIPLFLSNYTSAKTKNLFQNIIQWILKDHKKLCTIFVQATEGKRYDEKFVEYDKQEELSQIFNPFFEHNNTSAQQDLQEKNITLKKEVIKDLEGFFCKWEGQREQAIFYLNLAGIFAYCSSEFIFGEVDQSPNALRFFAVALLNRALEVGGAELHKPAVDGWIDRFLGLNVASTCTGELATSIFTICQCKENHPEIYHEIVPINWQ